MLSVTDEQGGVLGTHPDTGAEVRLKRGPYGWYVELAARPPSAETSAKQAAGAASQESAEGSAGGKGRKKGGKKAPAAARPKRVSLGKAMPRLTLEQALELLQWPKASFLESILTFACISLSQ